MKHFYILLLSILSFQGFSQTLYFSEYAEGGANNKYLEIYNPTGSTIDLSGYAYPNCNNGCDLENEFDYWNEFEPGAMIGPGEVYIIAHGSSVQSILDLADEIHSYLSNGDDFYALVQGTSTSYTVIDKIGDFGPDPGSGWAVADDTNGTQNQTLVRKSSVTQGNTDWVASAGTDAASSEWEVYAQDTFTYLGAAPGTTTLSTDISKQIQFSLYPNPVSSDVVYVSGVAGTKKAVLHDLMGRVVLKAKIKNQLNIAGVKKGVYLLELSSGNKKATKKLIVN